MKTKIKYTMLFFFIFFSFLFIFISSKNHFYDLYVNFLYKGIEFYGEDRGRIMFNVVNCIIFPLSIFVSFFVLFIIYCIERRCKKNE